MVQPVLALIALVVMAAGHPRVLLACGVVAAGNRCGLSGGVDLAAGRRAGASDAGGGGEARPPR